MLEKNQQQEKVRFMAVGDLMFCCALGEKLRASKDYDFPFAKIKEYLSQADFLYGNLETMITAKRQVEKFARPGLYYADPPVAAALGRANFKAVNLAHNHMYDFGAEAVELTKSLLADSGILHHGIGQDAFSAREPLEVEINGLMLGMLSYCSASTATDKKHKYVTCAINPDIIREDVAKLSKRVNIVSVTLHEGVCSYPSPQHRAWANAAVDAGAKLVISHHSHVINGIEEYKGAVIAYGLGDFVATYEGKKSRETFILDCSLKYDGTISYQLVPVWVNDVFQPEIAAGDRKVKISNYIEELSRKLRTGQSDKEYQAQMKRIFLGAQLRDVGLGIRAEGMTAIIRKLRKLRWYHIQLLFNSVFRKF